MGPLPKRLGYGETKHGKWLISITARGRSYLSPTVVGMVAVWWIKLRGFYLAQILLVPPPSHCSSPYLMFLKFDPRTTVHVCPCNAGGLIKVTPPSLPSPFPDFSPKNSPYRRLLSLSSILLFTILCHLSPPHPPVLYRDLSPWGHPFRLFHSPLNHCDPGLCPTQNMCLKHSSPTPQWSWSTFKFEENGYRLFQNWSAGHLKWYFIFIYSIYELI